MITAFKSYRDDLTIERVGWTYTRFMLTLSYAPVIL